jgi:6-phosphogluconate dehydrogenase
MQLGMIGLGRMGANIVRRLMRDGHDCVVYDVNQAAIAELEGEGALGARSLEEFASKLTTPRVAWIMVPAAFAAASVRDVARHFERGDIIIDGGNSYYRDDLDRAAECDALGVHFVDVGTSGGVFGLERGYCLMIGGEERVVARLRPIFETLAPGVEAAPRTPGRRGPASMAEHGYLHCGGHGAGHFVKMVHNGIEYGIMGAIAEGLAILKKADVGLQEHDKDAETSPLRNPEYYQYRFDMPEVAEVWRRGSVIGSWLLDLTAAALHDDPAVAGFSGRVSDSGEGRWTALAAIEESVPAHILTTALFERFSSRGEADYADKLLSAMRQQFGGHEEKPARDS